MIKPSKQTNFLYELTASSVASTKLSELELCNLIPSVPPLIFVNVVVSIILVEPARASKLVS